MKSPGRLRGDRGQVAPMMAVLTVAVLALSGLVLDGGRILAVRREANGLAASAARAGAQAIDHDAARRGDVRLDIERARLAAEAFLDQGGVIGTVDAFPDHVDVEVHMTAHIVLLSVVGQGDRPVTGRGSARIARGL